MVTHWLQNVSPTLKVTLCRWIREGKKKQKNTGARLCSSTHLQEQLNLLITAALCSSNDYLLMKLGSRTTRIWCVQETGTQGRVEWRQMPDKTDVSLLANTTPFFVISCSTRQDTERKVDLCWFNHISSTGPGYHWMGLCAARLVTVMFCMFFRLVTAAVMDEETTVQFGRPNNDTKKSN